MHIAFCSKVFYRVPQFAVNSMLVEEWEVLKISIREASLAFYETIRDVDADGLASLPFGVQHTIWKYFNRGKYRATPYGRFAGFGLAPLQTGGDSVVVASEQVLHTFPDWTLVEGLQKSFAELLETELLLVANSSYYRVGDCIRYVSRFDGAFQLSDVEVDEFQLLVLELCAQPILFGQLVLQLDLLETDYGLIEEMIALQLLLTSNDPNVIGEEYFKRVGAKDTDGSAYLLAERCCVSGAIDISVFKALPELIGLLAGLIPVKPNDNLIKFITAFKRRFEDQEVPLMVALDPELGLGYGDMEEMGNADEIVGHFAAAAHRLEENTAVAELRKAVLKSFLATGSFEGKVLDLALLTADLSAVAVKLPNTLSVVCSVTDGLVALDMMDGASANALLGRFTLANEEISEYAREVASVEALANPDVLFFDVAYMAEGRLDNINRRNRIYDLQLSILNYDTSDAPLELKDLYLFAQGDELVLFSKKLGKRLVPRIASAYNYIRSDLSVFRLLCDLQNQGLQTALRVSVEELFPDLSFYPRLQYKNIVVSPAKWLVVYAVVEQLLGVDDGLRAYLLGLGMERFVIFRSVDMTLCFDLLDGADLDALLVLLKKQGKMYLEEAFVPKDSVVNDEAGKPYMSQLILAMTHTEQVYAAFTAQLKVEQEHVGLRKTFPPGSEWLYFEIYGHVYRTDALLLGLIEPFLGEHEQYIKSWFFIRYSENGDHLRLRILLHDVADGQLVVSALSTALAAYLETGIISEILLKTYKRELDRYASGGMEKVEVHFGLDSIYVLSLLPLELAVMDKYRLCIDVAIAVMEAELMSDKVFDRLISKVCDAFALEHRLEVNGFKKLNEEYKGFKKSVPAVLDEAVLACRDVFVSSLIAVLENCELNKRHQLFASLMHMHVNRLFADRQRTHEMILYYFLSKELLMRKALATKKEIGV